MRNFLQQSLLNIKKTKDDEPTYSKTYRFLNHFKKDVEEQILEMLEDGVIIPSNSPYSSPIWVVPK